MVGPSRHRRRNIAALASLCTIRRFRDVKALISMQCDEVVQLIILTACKARFLRALHLLVRVSLHSCSLPSIGSINSSTGVLVLDTVHARVDIKVSGCSGRHNVRQRFWPPNLAPKFSRHILRRQSFNLTTTYPIGRYTIDSK